MARLRLGLAGALLLVLATGLLGPAAPFRAPAWAAGPGAAAVVGGAEIEAWTAHGRSVLSAFSDSWDDPDDDLSSRLKDEAAPAVPASSWRGLSADATAALRWPCPHATGPPVPLLG